MDVFSPRENEIIKIIGRKKVTLVYIAEELFAGKREPLDATISVNNSVRRINKKCEYHDLSWFLNIDKVNGKSLIQKVTV